jgi:hypothetical protein
MNQSQHSAIVSFIWGIADDVQRDAYVRGCATKVENPVG